MCVPDPEVSKVNLERFERRRSFFIYEIYTISGVVIFLDVPHRIKGWILRILSGGNQGKRSMAVCLVVFFLYVCSSAIALPYCDPVLSLFCS